MEEQDQFPYPPQAAGEQHPAQKEAQEKKRISTYGLRTDKEYGDKVLILTCDGADSFCHDQQPMLMPSAIDASKGTIMRLPCQSNCPLFDIVLVKGDFRANILCGAVPVSHVIDNGKEIFVEQEPATPTDNPTENS